MDPIFYTQHNRHSFHDAADPTNIENNTSVIAPLLQEVKLDHTMELKENDKVVDNLDEKLISHLDREEQVDDDEEDNRYTKIFRPYLMESMKHDATRHFDEWEKSRIDVICTIDQDQFGENKVDSKWKNSNDAQEYDPYWLETLAGDIPALHAALRKALLMNDVSTVEEFINFGVVGPANNISAMCEYTTGRTPIWYAASAGSNECITLLAEWCFNSIMNEFYKQRQQGWQEQEEREAKIKVQKEVTAFLNQPTKYGSRPLLIATACNHPTTVQTLIDYNVDVNVANEYNSTAALLAASEGHFEILNILAKHGANLDLPNLQGTTPVIVATQNGRVDIIKFLYLYGVNLNHVNEMGMSCVAIAAYYNKV